MLYKDFSSLDLKFKNTRKKLCVLFSFVDRKIEIKEDRNTLKDGIVTVSNTLL